MLLNVWYVTGVNPARLISDLDEETRVYCHVEEKGTRCRMTTFDLGIRRCYYFVDWVYGIKIPELHKTQSSFMFILK